MADSAKGEGLDQFLRKHIKDAKHPSSQKGSSRALVERRGSWDPRGCGAVKVLRSGWGKRRVPRLGYMEACFMVRQHTFVIGT